MKVGRHKSVLSRKSGRLIRKIQSLPCVKKISVGISKGCTTHVQSGTVIAKKISNNSVLVDLFSERGVTELWVIGDNCNVSNILESMSHLGVITGNIEAEGLSIEMKAGQHD